MFDFGCYLFQNLLLYRCSDDLSMLINSEKNCNNAALLFINWLFIIVEQSRSILQKPLPWYGC